MSGAKNWQVIMRDASQRRWIILRKAAVGLAVLALVALCAAAAQSLIDDMEAQKAAVAACIRKEHLDWKTCRYLVREGWRK